MSLHPSNVSCFVHLIKTSNCWDSWALRGGWLIESDNRFPRKRIGACFDPSLALSVAATFLFWRGVWGGDYGYMEEVDGADDLDGDGLLGEEEELHVDRGSSVTSSRLPPPPCSRTILDQESP